MGARKQISIGLENETCRRLDAEARRRAVGRGKLIELLIENWLDAVTDKEIDLAPPSPPCQETRWHFWPCRLFYAGNWDGDRPRMSCDGDECRTVVNDGPDA